MNKYTHINVQFSDNTQNITIPTAVAQIFNIQHNDTLLDKQYYTLYNHIETHKQLISMQQYSHNNYIQDKLNNINQQINISKIQQTLYNILNK